MMRLMFFVDKMSSRPPYQTVETYMVNKTAFAEFCFSKLFSRSFVSNLVAKLSRGTGLLECENASRLIIIVYRILFLDFNKYRGFIAIPMDISTCFHILSYWRQQFCLG